MAGTLLNGMDEDLRAISWWFMTHIHLVLGWGEDGPHMRPIRVEGLGRIPLP